MTESINAYQGRWVLIGDLNQVENKDQKLGGTRYLKGANNFLNWRLQNKLIEIHFHGVKYTWTNNREGDNAIYERMDKAFNNND